MLYANYENYINSIIYDYFINLEDGMIKQSDMY